MQALIKIEIVGTNLFLNYSKIIIKICSLNLNSFKLIYHVIVNYSE